MTMKLKVRFDQPVDVLHISYGEYDDYEGDHLADGLELDFSIPNDEPCGAKVIGFNRNGWRSKLDDLSLIIGNHLAVNSSTVRHAILQAVDRKSTTL